ncbi:hypothetical protein GCWU000325_02428 [Alloprevotella tannerae ATCC 51259]|uniref:Uncharacterized protein n=1 Tax=Alloprevotella tannerae ATCC 51259 TaxID=626522 RepID=C9LJL5_9BACT|nr:hypothetical protein GCWU000325_02428 [Alloprevotella tannerae ATCC 51259]
MRQHIFFYKATSRQIIPTRGKQAYGIRPPSAKQAASLLK